MTPFHLSFGVMAALLLVGGCSGKKESKPPAPPTKVGVATVERAPIERSLHISGPLRFTANTTVSAEVAAQVKSIVVQDGQAVEQGQLLLVFDDVTINENAIHAASTLQKDEATLAFLKGEYEKNLKLFEKGSVSHTMHDQKLSELKASSAQVEMDRAVLAKAMEDMKRTRVKSPVKGRISKRFVEKGDWVTVGGKLFQVSDYSKIYLEAHLSDVDLAKLDLREVFRSGQDAEVYVDSYPGKVFNGRLTYIEPVANEQKLFQVRIYMDNPEMTLLQGMFARGRITYDTLKDVLRIPLAALLDQIRNNEQNSVFVVGPDQKAVLTRIKLGTTNRQSAQVLGGLEEGQLVVVNGKEILTSGQLVEQETRPSALIPDQVGQEASVR
ncbi:MAG: efflux RND transporter periplasmic adaptor subunit [Deltaproteobacteria bacterium]|nr:efflux RND transporter periplasmic adaptor subunit [Deltaproteobacteria bacterium]